MGKAKLYGMKTEYNPKRWRDKYYRKKFDPMPREKRNPVEGPQTQERAAAAGATNIAAGVGTSGPLSPNDVRALMGMKEMGGGTL